MFSTRGSHWHHFPSCPRGLKKGRTPLSDYFISGGESVLGGWRPRAAAEETLAGTAHGTRAFVQESTENPVSCFSTVQFFMVTFHSKGRRDQKEGIFPATSPLQVSSQDIQWTYLPASSGRSESLFRMAAPCSLLLVLFSVYSFFKHFLISRSRSLQ